jgi:hypothetical protein
MRGASTAVRDCHGSELIATDASCADCFLQSIASISAVCVQVLLAAVGMTERSSRRQLVVQPIAPPIVWSASFVLKDEPTFCRGCQAPGHALICRKQSHHIEGFESQDRVVIHVVAPLLLFASPPAGCGRAFGVGFSIIFQISSVTVRRAPAL